MFLKKFSWEFTNEGSNLYFNSGPNYQICSQTDENFCMNKGFFVVGTLSWCQTLLLCQT